MTAHDIPVRANPWSIQSACRCQAASALAFSKSSSSGKNRFTNPRYHSLTRSVAP